MEIEILKYRDLKGRFFWGGGSISPLLRVEVSWEKLFSARFNAIWCWNIIFPDVSYCKYCCHWLELDKVAILMGRRWFTKLPWHFPDLIISIEFRPFSITYPFTRIMVDLSNDWKKLLERKVFAFPKSIFAKNMACLKWLWKHLSILCSWFKPSTSTAGLKFPNAWREFWEHLYIWIKDSYCLGEALDRFRPIPDEWDLGGWL